VYTRHAFILSTANAVYFNIRLIYSRRCIYDEIFLRLDDITCSFFSQSFNAKLLCYLIKISVYFANKNAKPFVLLVFGSRKK
jgi:hypothetical protein